MAWKGVCPLCRWQMGLLSRKTHISNNLSTKRLTLHTPWLATEEQYRVRDKRRKKEQDHI
jgi:hypothetical protein